MFATHPCCAQAFEQALYVSGCRSSCTSELRHINTRKHTITGSTPILARVGRLERALLQQAAVADAWAGAREVAEKTAAAALEKDKAAKGVFVCERNDG